MNWKPKLEKFLKNFKYLNDIQGILVCGSYINGAPTSHSDLDVHFILKDNCDYRVKLNKEVDGLMIECFINPPKQIRKYFEEDYKSFEQSSMNQFATGEIYRDDTGIISQLKDEAVTYIKAGFSNVNTSLNELQKYALWDMLDDLQDGVKELRNDFDLIYFKYLDKVLKLVSNHYKVPYSTKTIYKSQFDEVTRFKYSLPQIPNKEISNIIVSSITEKSNKNKLAAFKLLVEFLWSQNNGFDINTFEFKSPISIN